MASKATPLPPWESQSLDYQFPEEPAQVHNEDQPAVPRDKWRKIDDSVIYPGLYSPSGIDMMDILSRLINRPCPQIELGAVDCSVALVLCDLELPNAPILYVSDPFCKLTGYSKAEVMGRNCRFLQYPGGIESSASKPSTSVQDEEAIARLRQAVLQRKEIQLEITNYKKDGQPFNNFLTIIPLEMDQPGYHCAVGFQVEAD